MAAGLSKFFIDHLSRWIGNGSFRIVGFDFIVHEGVDQELLPHVLKEVLLPPSIEHAIRHDNIYWHYPHYSNQGGEPGCAIREGDWKLIEFHTDGRHELFNLREDVSETRNQIKREPDVARRLIAKLEAWKQETRAIMPAKNPNADPAWPGWNLAGEEKPTPP
jgi:arylsulfatase A-like enzyme